MSWWWAAVLLLVIFGVIGAVRGFHRFRDGRDRKDN